MGSPMMALRVADGFVVNMTRHIRDDSNSDLPLLDILGPKQAVRATWAKLKSRKTFTWMLGGSSKLNKDPGHRVIKKDMPNGWVNWTFISKQAIPSILDASTPTYCWYEPREAAENLKPPANFFPVYMAAMPFPVLPDWKDFLWQKGLDQNCIKKLGDCTTVSGYKIYPRLETWSDIINAGFKTEHLNIGIPVPNTPKQKPTDDANLLPTDGAEFPNNFLPDNTANEPIFQRFKGSMFPLGQIVMTPYIHSMTQEGFNPIPYLKRHAEGDWGDLEHADKQENKLSLEQGFRIFSSYKINDDDKIWIITEADRSSTCILLPKEY